MPDWPSSSSSIKNSKQAAPPNAIEQWRVCHLRDLDMAYQKYVQVYVYV